MKVTHYVWEGNQVVGEYNGSSGALIVSYVSAGSRLIAKTVSGTTQYFLSDRLSIRLALTDGGVISGRQATLPFGEDFGESGTQEKHHFTSYDRDAESGTDYAVNRQYNQSVGRFVSADHYQQSQGASNTQSFNRYAYVLNQPVDYVDSLGLNMEAPHPPVSDYSGSCELEYGLVFNEGVPSVGVRAIRCSGYPGGSSQDPSGRPPAEPCDVQIPTDPNGRAAVAVLLGEATPEYRIGQQQYQNGDKPDHPTGETTITSDLVYAEMVEMVSVISNRARVGGFGGSSWEDVATSGGFLGYAQGDQMLKDNKFGNNGSPECERLRRAVKATNYVAQSGPTDTTALYWRGVVQGRRRHRFVRNQDDATRIGDTDFF